MQRQTETQWSSKRVNCVACGSLRGFAPITIYDSIDVSDGNFGKCFACNYINYPNSKDSAQATHRPIKRTKQVNTGIASETERKLILNDLYNRSMKRYRLTPFAKYLHGIIGEPIFEQLQNNCIGGDYQDNTVFWYHNISGNLSHCKIIPYGNDGHRLKKELSPIVFSSKEGLNHNDSINGLCTGTRPDGLPKYEFTSNSKGYNTSIIYNENYLKIGYRYKSIISGEQITYDQDTKIILVESEKSALLGSFIMPEFIWIACGGVSGLNIQKAIHLKDRTVSILFDNDNAGKNRSQITYELLQNNIQCKAKFVQICTPEELEITNQKGYDIADSIIDLLQNKDNLYHFMEKWHIIRRRKFYGKYS